VDTPIQNPQSAEFIHALAALQFDTVFNPYSQVCTKYDLPNAPSIRRCNLENILNAATSNGVDSLWIARDLGFRGGRRTGLALTDEINLRNYAKLFKIPQLMKATEGSAMAERTATIIWKALQIIDRPIFLWNVFPLHPHEPGKPMSNRCHTRLERNVCLPLLIWLIQTLRPNKVIAIGKDAHSILNSLSMKSFHVRHPSYGGQSDFLRGIAEQYSVCLK
jgi:hypothetical protein